MSGCEERLFTSSFLAICCANLLIFTAFYMLFPVLPIYLMDELQAQKGTIGAILSAYTIGTLSIRPIAGFMVDRYPRKVLYVLFAALFSLFFSGYLLLHVLLLIGILRALHGLAFGMLTTSSTTIAVDIMPVSKIGTGIGIYGVTTSTAMAIGPMLGMLILEKTSYPFVFASSMGCAIAGCLCGMMVRHNKTIPPVKSVSLSLDNFFLKKGIHAFFSQALCGFFYGLLVNFLSVFARERGIEPNPGFFFCLLAIGLILSRFFAGGMIDKGYIGKLIVAGTLLTALAGLVFILVPGQYPFFLSAVGIGMGYGMLTPAYQTLFINFASPSERGKANSTFFISWDGSIGLAVFLGGLVSQAFGLQIAYLLGVGLLFCSVFCFIYFTLPDIRALHR